MKKILSALFAASMVLMAVGCGAAGDTGKSSSELSTQSVTESSSTQNTDGSDANGKGTPAIDKIKEKGKLVMATNAAFPPFEYIKDNQVVGVDVDIASEIAKDLGVELQIEDMEFNGIIAALQAGKADIGVAGITIREDRKEQVDFSNEYVSSAQYVIIVKGSGTTVESLKEKGVKIGAQEGTTGYNYSVDDIKGDPNTEDVAAYKNALVAAQDLMNGKCAAVIIDELPAKNIVAANPDKLELLAEPLTNENYAIAVKKDSADLVDAINQTIERLKSEGKIDTFVLNHTAQ